MSVGGGNVQISIGPEKYDSVICGSGMKVQGDLLPRMKTASGQLAGLFDCRLIHSVSNVVSINELSRFAASSEL